MSQPLHPKPSAEIGYLFPEAAQSEARRPHAVQFYRDQPALLSVLSAFVRDGLERGDSVVVIATQPQLQALEKMQHDRLLVRDASETLLQVGGDEPEASRFDAAIRPLIDDAQRRSSSGRVRAYGEMGDLLWRRGFTRQVLALEEMWDQLVASRPLDLLCTYCLDSFLGEHCTLFFGQLCAAHSHVHPSPVLTALGAGDQLRLIARLEQRAGSLEQEVEIRRRMQRVTEALADLLTVEEVASAGLDVIIDAIGADFGSLTLPETVRQSGVATNDDITHLPLMVRGEQIGSLSFGVSGHRHAGDQNFIVSIASQCAQAIDRARLYQSERYAREEAEMLFRLSEAVNRAESLAQLYPQALDAICSLLAVERAAILLYDPDERIRFKAWRGLSDEYRQAVEGHSPWSRRDRDPHAIFVDDVDTDPSMADYRDILHREGIAGLGFVPLFQQGRLMGKLVMYSGTPRHFDQRDRHLASTIASQITQAVARAELAHRTTRLQDVTALLATVSTASEVADVVVTLGGAAISAATGGVWIVDEEAGDAHMIRYMGYRDEDAARYQRLPLDGSVRIPVADAIASKEPLWFDSKATFDARYPGVTRAPYPDPELAVACLPMNVEGRCIGALVFTFDEVRFFPEETKQFLLLLAANCAQALERARRYDSEKASREQAEAAHQRSSFLVEASAILSSSLEFREAVDRVVALAVPRIADWSSVQISTEIDAIAGAPELHHELDDTLIETLARDERERDVIRELRLHSALVVPLVARGRSFGKLHFGSKRQYTQADLELAELLGRRAGISIDNAILYQSAQDAARAREEVLAVVSHDLRNPLNVIFMSAVNLMRIDDKAGRVRKSAETIQRSAERMSRLIGDLLDFASMQSGRFTIERSSCSPEEVVSAALEMFAALAVDRDLVLDARVPADLPQVRCDRDRIIQALGNLVANAVKVTATGGSIAVGAEIRGQELVLFVEDTGPGLSPEQVPRLFDRYWRGDNARYKGTGLGLTIAKGIVDAHGGRIWAESTVGVGSRFSFAIPT